MTPFTCESLTRHIWCCEKEGEIRMRHRAAHQAHRCLHGTLDSGNRGRRSWPKDRVSASHFSLVCDAGECCAPNQHKCRPGRVIQRYCTRRTKVLEYELKQHLSRFRFLEYGTDPGQESAARGVYRRTSMLCRTKPPHRLWWAQSIVSRAIQVLEKNQCC